MSDPQIAAFEGFDNPMAVVDSIDMTYEARLEILQQWQSALARAGASDDRQSVIMGAIHALEMGAAVQDDGPEEAPDNSGYGVGESDSASDPQSRKA